MAVKKRPSDKRKKRSNPTSPLKAGQSTHHHASKRARPPTQPVSHTTPYTSATSNLVQCREDVLYDVGTSDEIPFFKLLEAILPLDSPQSVMAVWSVVLGVISEVFQVTEGA
jgi:hypothetical protein